MKKTILIIALLFLTNCRTVKKSWLKDNYVSKSEANLLKKSIDSTLAIKTTDIIERIAAVKKETTNNVTESNNKVTEIQGTIDAVEGEIKTATIGNTTIVSNGANISFKTSEIANISKEYKELNSLLESERIVNERIKNEVKSIKNEFTSFKQKYESEREATSKEIRKSGVKFWFLLSVVLAALLYFVFKLRF